MSTPTTVDGTADEITDAVEATDEPIALTEQPPAGALVPIASPSGAIIRADDPREILAKAREIAQPLAELIDSAGLAKALDRRNPDRKHVEVGGWQATGTMLGALGGQPLHAETVWTRRVAGEDGQLQRTKYTATVKRFYSKNQGGGLREEVTYDVDGYDWEACVEVKTPEGVVVGRAEAMVSRAENTWSQRDDYALRSMAETRAESRAWRKAIGWIVHLAGYNPTPAEEMGHTPGASEPEPAAAPLPAWVAPIESTDKLRKAIGYFFDVDPSHPWIDGVLDKVRADTGGQIPSVAARAVMHLALAHRTIAGQAADHAAAAQQPATSDSAGPPAEPNGQTTLGADRPAPGTVALPPRTGNPVADITALRDAGCICESPLEADRATTEGSAKANDECPMSGHGIPF